MQSENNAPNEVQKEMARLLHQAYANFKSGEYAQAESLCREVLSQRPKNPNALLMLGMVYVFQNRLDEAKIPLADAYQAAPENSSHLMQLAPGLSRVGLHGDAANCWETLARLDPENEQLVTNLGAALCMDSKPQEATKAFEKAIVINPDCVGAHLNLGITYQKLGNAELAERSFRKVLDLKPLDEMASAQLGELLQLEDRVDEAVKIYNNALLDTPQSAQLLYGLYGACFESEGADMAVDMLEKAVADKPEHFLSRSCLGMMLDHIGRKEEAELHFDYVRTHTPEYAFIIDSWYYAREHFGPQTRLFTLSNSGLANAIENTAIDGQFNDGLFLEFGVWQGRSINYISSCIDGTVHGFDSFEGIPDAWEGMPGGSYSTFGKLPDVNANVVLHSGWFENSLPAFLESNQGSVAFINIDCDTYDSTKTIFDVLGENIKVGTVIVFDEYFCYPNWRDHEYKAFQEYLQASAHQYEYLFFNLYTRQAGVLITS